MKKSVTLHSITIYLILMCNNYSNIIDSFENVKVLIIGDVMLDSYIMGRVDRISPEAPVPIVNVTNRKYKLGGAANVALNLRMLGAKPFICGIVGEDVSSTNLKKLLRENDISIKGILSSSDRVTTVKFRIIGNNTQLLRVDEEQTDNLNSEDSEKLISIISKAIKEEKIDVIIFQDYDKGVITIDLIRRVFELANQYQIPITVDPKKRNFFNYRGATLFKPNLKELKDGFGITFNHHNEAELNLAVSRLLNELNLKYAMVTLSEDGIIIGCNEKGQHITHRAPTEVISVADVSGAGDTVISVASLCIAKQLDPEQVMLIANVAAGIVCEQVGVVPVDKNRLIQRLNKIK